MTPGPAVHWCPNQTLGDTRGTMPLESMVEYNVWSMTPEAHMKIKTLFNIQPQFFESVSEALGRPIRLQRYTFLAPCKLKTQGVCTKAVGEACQQMVLTPDTRTMTSY